MLNKKLLLVEDDVDISTLLIDLLKNKGFDLTHVADGKKALQTINDQNFDIILLDEMLPSMRGSEVLVRVKANNKTCHIPVIMMTSIKDDDHQTKVLNIGADDYIHKPVRINILMARIESVLRRTVVSAIEVPPEATPTQLSSKELDVLALVVKGYNNAKIAETLVLSEYTISNHIKSILSKLKADNRTHAAIIALKLNVFN